MLTLLQGDLNGLSAGDFGRRHEGGFPVWGVVLLSAVWPQRLLFRECWLTCQVIGRAVSGQVKQQCVRRFQCFGVQLCGSAGGDRVAATQSRSIHYQ